MRKKLRKIQKKRKVNWKVLVFCLIFVFISAGIGSYFTSANVDSQWYYLIKSNITPANWVFPVVWNTLFVLISYSLYFGWMKVRENKSKKRALITLFSVNLILNILWCFLFFYQMNPLGAFIELLFLVLSILSLIWWLWEIERKASYLLLPYLVWVLFAALLNWQAYINSTLMG